MSPTAKLPVELLEEILVLLPSRSLIRSRSVSKQWLELIKSNPFVIRHHSMVNAHNLAPFQVSLPLTRICYDEDFTMYDLSVRSSKIDLLGSKRIPVEIVSAGFGIYCVIKKINESMHMWNPTTRKSIQVSPPPRGYAAFPNSFYFGKVDYEDGVFSYIVGMITARFPHGLHEYNFSVPTSWSVELYSSKTKCWTFIPNVYHGKAVCSVGGLDCINLNGKAHWLTYHRVGFDLNIATFDYENQVLDWIPFQFAPENGKYIWLNDILTLWDEGFLCLLLSWEKDNNLFHDIWVMREYGVEDAWSKELTVGPFSMETRVFGFSSKLQVLFIMPDRSFPLSLVMYDLKSSLLKDISLPSNEYCWRIRDHEESLISL